MSGVPKKDVGFYDLSPASQMIVWAVRKRLHLLSHGADDSEVAGAFRSAGLDELHAALMSIVDVLLCGVSNRIQIHAVSCPCLAPHETSLLSALAHLQDDDHGEAQRQIAELMCAAAVRLVMPCMRAIIRDLDARGMRLGSVESSNLSVASRFSGAIH